MSRSGESGIGFVSPGIGVFVRMFVAVHTNIERCPAELGRVYTSEACPYMGNNHFAHRLTLLPATATFLAGSQVSSLSSNPIILDVEN